MRSHTAFEDFGQGFSRLEHPGDWQVKVVDDLNVARGLLQADWHPGWLQNRRGFALSPHFLHAVDYTPPERRRTIAGTTANVEYAGSFPP